MASPTITYDDEDDCPPPFYRFFFLNKSTKMVSEMVAAATAAVGTRDATCLELQVRSFFLIFSYTLLMIICTSI